MAKQIKILFLITDSHFGGAEKVVYELIKNLDREVFLPELMVLKRKGEMARKVENLGIKVSCLDLGERVNFKYLFKLPFGALKLWRKFKQEKIDILHCHLFQANILGSFLGKLAKIPVIICTSHSFETRWWRKLLNALAGRLTDNWVAISFSLKRHLEQENYLSTNKLTVIKNGIELRKESKEEKIPEQLGKLKKPIIGTIARLHPVKNLDLLIKAFKEVLKSFPESHLVIIGEGSEKTKLKNLVRNLKLEEKVLMPGFQPQPEKWLKWFDIFVLPSFWEGIPVSLLEAMGYAKPVIVSDIEAFREVIISGKNGLIFPVRDVQGLARAMIEVLKNPSLAEKMGKEAQKTIEQEYSLSRMVEEYQKLYLELWERKSSFQKPK